MKLVKLLFERLLEVLLAYPTATVITALVLALVLPALYGCWRGWPLWKLMLVPLLWELGVVVVVGLLFFWMMVMFAKAWH